MLNLPEKGQIIRCSRLIRMSSSSSAYSNPPCAACKFLRRKCVSGCVFAPYFGPEEPVKFFNVHRVFGASNVSKLLSQLPPHHRHDAVSSLAYEAEARLRDPVYGCVGAIYLLQTQLLILQKQLDATNAHIMRFSTTNIDQSVVDPNENGFGLFDPNSGLSSPWSPGFTGPGEGDQDGGNM